MRRFLDYIIRFQLQRHPQSPSTLREHMKRRERRQYRRQPLKPRQQPRNAYSRHAVREMNIAFRHRRLFTYCHHSHFSAFYFWGYEARTAGQAAA